jgi:Lipase (class 3)
MNKKIRDRINGILTKASQQNWSEKSFSLTKAHVCAELCAIVYEEIKEYELKKASRIHLFASDKFLECVRSGTPNSIMASLTDLTVNDYKAQFFLLPSRYSVVLGVKLKDVVFLAVRGTTLLKLWDWKANIDSRKFVIAHRGLNALRNTDMHFHRGFFEAIVPQLPSISERIDMLGAPDVRVIVWTGHSLGGAIAAIGNAMTDWDYVYRFRPWFLDMDHREFKGNWSIKEEKGENLRSVAYTFGMPRYGSLGVICSFPNPYHIYDRQDLVPTVPLRRMEYADSSNEYVIDGNGKIEAAERTDTFGVIGHLLKFKSSLKAHSIDGYTKSIAESLHIDRP